MAYLEEGLGWLWPENDVRLQEEWMWRADWA